MKNKVLILGSAAALMLGFAAVGQANISATKHNLSFGSANTIKGATAASTKVCEYCHAPHKPKVNVPLWNRLDPAAAGFTYYQNAATMSAAGQAAALTAGSISMQCLSCHAETVAVMGTNAENAALKADGLQGAWTAINLIGYDLSNDHPVGFNYDTAQGQRGQGANVGTALVASTAGAKVGTLPLFSNRLECATCHMVHDNTNGFFLRVAPAALCGTCHTN